MKITQSAGGALLLLILSLLWSCSDEETAMSENFPGIEATFGNKINLAELDNYANQPIPSYITKDNTTNNPITDKGATLGRVLFYDLNLSKDNTISCASCHQQRFAFADEQTASEGVNGFTGRHSMRLVNSRFSTEQKFFWDERAATLENQTTQPIQDHKEMGFSSSDGDPSINDLFIKLQALPYYQELFTFVYGDPQITEDRMQKALAQFVRSIQSFDSKYDMGRVQVNNDNVIFPNFNATENLGKSLFLTPPQFDGTGNRINGGAGCQGCHRAPEFDIDPNTKNNGVIGVIGSSTLDLTNTRAPSLRDMVTIDGALYSQAMHDASLTSLEAIINHYNVINDVGPNNNLDQRLRPAGNLQKLQLTDNEKLAIASFLQTLSGTQVLTEEKWSNPF